MNIILKDTGEADIPFVIEAERDEANSPYVAQWDFNTHRDSLMENDIKHLLIFDERNNRPVGYTVLAGFSGDNRSVELKRIVITEKGKGYGQEALTLIKKMIFADMGYHRLWLDVRDHNIRAKNIYEKNGFVVEGHLRECVYVNDHYESIYIMSILKNEYSD